MNHILQGDCIEVMKKMPSNSIDLIVTSPPYNLGKEYEQDLSLSEYLDFLQTVLRECYRVLKFGGRICWNVMNQIFRCKNIAGIWSPSFESANLMQKIGFKFFDYLIWYQGYSSKRAETVYGSPRSPFLNHRTEALLVFFKGTWKRQEQGKINITPAEYRELSKSEIWCVEPESDRTHPAPFPLELPRRCIKLFTFVDDVVLDPFAGSGTTCLAAESLGRKWIGIEKEERYCKMARERLHDPSAKR